jgi:hypothetical protein
MAAILPRPGAANKATVSIVFEMSVWGPVREQRSFAMVLHSGRLNRSSVGPLRGGRVQRAVIVPLVAFAAIVCAATASFAQNTSSIAGVVKDATGAVLPGVTVEASSPVLIEKVRTVVTDPAGQ